MITSPMFLLLVTLYVLVQCEIPDLSVRRLDRTLIAKKRQDTLDMCRIFTEENAKLQHTKPKIIHESRGRYKREIDVKYAVNPALNEEDKKRVENIVEKLYDDMEERGENVTYKKMIETTTVTVKTPMNASANEPIRRLYFAPSLMKGPSPSLPLNTPTYNPPVSRKARWKHGIVPYFIDSKTYDAELQDTIMKAFDYVEKATCIRLQKLRERPMDKKSLQNVAWVYITNPSGIRQCVHSNEKRIIDGVQLIVFGYDCLSVGDIVHEVMHILGFSHEHTRSDRDRHISILWDNIKPGYKKYFELNTVYSQYDLESLPYDYASVMHYPPRAFSKNGQVTITTEFGIKIGQREGLSEIDVQKVGLVYASECVDRNRDYLRKTCPSVVKQPIKPVNVTQKKIENYFKKRLWPFGIVNYKLRDEMEFSTEERENIKAVIRHIEKETCIQFRDVSADDSSNNDNTESDSKSKSSGEGKQENRPYITSTSMEQTIQQEEPEIIFADPLLPGHINKSLSLGDKRESENEVQELGDEQSGMPQTLSEVEQKLDFENEINTEISDNDLSITRSKFKANQTSGPKRVRRTVWYPSNGYRRHANSIYVLTRSPNPGCTCPPPGKPVGNKILTINADCFNSVNDLLHLFVHVLGLDHQHNMHDRDSYLHIVWKNLTPDIKREIRQKLPPAAAVGFPYDYQSVMHYPWLQIKNGVTNIMYPIWNDGWAMGHWQGLSSMDVQKLNLLYFVQCMERNQKENA